MTAREAAGQSACGGYPPTQADPPAVWGLHMAGPRSEP